MSVYRGIASGIRCQRSRDRQGGLGDDWRSSCRRSPCLGCFNPKPLFGSRWPFSNRRPRCSRVVSGGLKVVSLLAAFFFFIMIFIYTVCGKTKPQRDRNRYKVFIEFSSLIFLIWLAVSMGRGPLQPLRWASYYRISLANTGEELFTALVVVFIEFSFYIFMI